MTMVQPIHRLGCSGGTRCGKPGRASVSGALVTCPECVALDRKPKREEQIAALERAVAEMHAARAVAQ